MSTDEGPYGWGEGFLHGAIESVETAIHELEPVLIRRDPSGIERLVGLYSDPAYQIVRYPHGRAIQFGTCLIACPFRSGNLQGSEEGTAWAWFSPATLSEDLTPYARVWLWDALSSEQQVVVR